MNILKQEFINEFITFLNAKEKENATEYLFNNKTNKEYLINAIKEVEEEKDLVEVNLEELKKGIFPEI